MTRNLRHLGESRIRNDADSCLGRVKSLEVIYVNDLMTVMTIDAKEGEAEGGISCKHIEEIMSFSGEWVAN